MAKRIDLVGDQFGRLVVIEKVPPRSWKVLCSCGSEAKIVRHDHLVSGATRSCGCLQKESRIKHGYHDSRIYSVWEGMIQRCTNVNDINYKHYGGRGIKVCGSWRVFTNFLKDNLESYSDSLELNRIDNNGDYCPENCNWIPHKENSRNQRKQYNNKSGHTGVYYSQAGNKWVAQWYEEGKAKTKCFSCRRHGSDRAKEMAISYRTDKIDYLNSLGYNYSPQHGF